MMIKREYFAYNEMMLEKKIPKYYQVKEGQTVLTIAEFFSLPPSLLVKENHLKAEVYAGQILKIPSQKGNLYHVQMGDNKTLLCGGEENYRQKNGTDLLFPYQKIFL